MRRLAPIRWLKAQGSFRVSMAGGRAQASGRAVQGGRIRLQPLRDSSGPEGRFMFDSNGTAGSRALSHWHINRQGTLAAVLCLFLLAGTLPAQQSSETPYTFKARSEVVLVNVVARDKKGSLVRDLTPEISRCWKTASRRRSRHSTSRTPTPPLQPRPAPSRPPCLARPSPGAEAKQRKPCPFPAALKDRRLIILFFDLSAMQADEIDRSVAAALKYVDQQMSPADLVSVVSLGSSLHVNQDFTSDRALLTKALEHLNPSRERVLKKAPPAPPKARPTPAGLSRPTTPSTTSSTPTAGWKRCAPWPPLSPASSRRNL